LLAEEPVLRIDASQQELPQRTVSFQVELKLIVRIRNGLVTKKQNGANRSRLELHVLNVSQNRRQGQSPIPEAALV
jgi:hypothetical protein